MNVCLFVSVRTLLLLAFLILLLCLSLGIVLRAGLLTGGRNLSVSPKRIVLMFHTFLRSVPQRSQYRALRMPLLHRRMISGTGVILPGIRSFIHCCSNHFLQIVFFCVII